MQAVRRDIEVEWRRLCAVPCRRLADTINKRKPANRYVERLGKLRRTYGISGVDFDAMWAEQSGLCAICHIHMTLTEGRGLRSTDVCVDHNHTTNQVRGLLCADCNVGIARLKESKTIMLTAIEYVS